MAGMDTYEVFGGNNNCFFVLLFLSFLLYIMQPPLMTLCLFSITYFPSLFAPCPFSLVRPIAFVASPVITPFP